jgi:hypothetical protein
MQKACQPLITSTIQPIMQGTIESLSLKVMIDALGGFKVTRKWTRQFLNQYREQHQQINFQMIGNNKGKTWVTKLLTLQKL